MRGNDHGILEGHGPVRYGPPLPDDGLPVLPELAAAAAAADPAVPEPPGGTPSLLDAACGYWLRRGLPTEPGSTAAAPGGVPLLLALTAAIGGDVLLPRPCPAWWEPQARLLGRSVFHVATPAECGGVPDPYALLETVRRVRAEGGDPRLLVLSVADDPTGTVAPPEILHEAIEAAAAEGLHIVSDETWRDTLHRDPARTTVLIDPAEMMPEHVTVVTDLTGAYLPPGLPAAVARLPATARGPRCAPASWTSSRHSAPSSPAPPRRPPHTRWASPPGSPRACAPRPPSTRAWPPPCTARCSTPADSPGRPRPAVSCTRTWTGCAPHSPPAVSGTPRTWRTASPSGSACPPPGATASATTSPHCAYACPPAHSSAQPRRSA